MRIRWLIATALAYGVPGGFMLYDQLWASGRGLTWTRDSTERLLWAIGVFVVSTVVLARRHPARGKGWQAAHAAAAFLLGALVGWGVIEWRMMYSQHGWDRGLPDWTESLYCTCAPFLPILRQTLLAAAIGAAAAAGLAPLVARVFRPGASTRLPA